MRYHSDVTTSIKTMESRYKARVRLQHCILTSHQGKDALRYLTTVPSSENALDMISLNVITENMDRLAYGSWADIEGDPVEGSRGAMIDIVTDQFTPVTNPEEDIQSSSSIDLVGRVHSKTLGLEDCLVLEVRAKGQQCFFG